MGSMQPDLALLLPDTTSSIDAFGISTPASLGVDTRPYQTPKSNPLTVLDHNISSVDDSSPSRASLHVPASHTTLSSLLPHLIDLTSDPEGLVHIKHPGGRPKETSLNGPLEPPLWPLPDSTGRRGGPRNYRTPRTSTTVKRPVGSPTQSTTVTNNAGTRSSSARPHTSFSGVYPSEGQTGHVSMQSGVTSLVSALSSAFSQNAIQDLGPHTSFSGVYPSEGHTGHVSMRSGVTSLVSALSSAFSQNAIQDLEQNLTSAFANITDDDESSDRLFDPNLDSLPPKRRRRRIAPQISPVKRIRPKQIPKVSYVVPSETTVTTNVEHVIEHLSVDLPLGVSIAPENESKYVDPEDEMLLDYDSSSEIIEERKNQEKLETNLSALTLKNNLRFLSKEAPSQLSTPWRIPRQYTISAAPSRDAYLQRVKEYCGDRAFGSILDEILCWEASVRPRSYFRPQAPINDLVPESGTPELSETSRAGENGGHATQAIKRSYPEDDLAPYKKMKFSDTVSEVSFQSIAATSGNSSDSYPNFDVGLCGELLQKLVKGKVLMSSQEIERVLSFFGSTTFQRLIRQWQVGDGDELDFLSTDNLQACDSIWQALQHISVSPPGALGIPEFVESTLRWETQKMIRFVTAR